MSKSETETLPVKQEQSTELSKDFASQLAGLAGQGIEGVRKEDLLMPRLTILQALSPQVNERKVEFVEGAKPGLIINTATNQFWPEIHFLPVAYQRRHIEWRPRKQGGGLVHDYGTDPSILDQCEPSPDGKGPPRTPDGNELVVAGTWYGLNLSDDGSQGFIAMSSTQLKKSRRWMTMATSERVRNPDTGQMFQPPLLYRTYRLGVGPENNDQGDWFGWIIKPDINIEQLVNISNNRAILTDARNLLKAVSEGSVIARAEAFGEEREQEPEGTF